MLRSTLLLLALLPPFVSMGQVNELGGTIGLSYYIGDLNPYKHFPKDKKLAYGLVYRHNVSNRIAFRLQGLTSMLQSYDSNSSDTLQQMRNLSFRARLIEASLLLEINFFPYRTRGRQGGRQWTPFIFAGIAYFRASPQAQLDDTWYDLQQLGTEGQGSSAGGEVYPVDHMAVPFGGGVKLNAGRIDFQLEWGMRRTWTDYIDDVSGNYVDNAILAFENGPLAATFADRSGVEDAIPGYENTGRARGDANTRDWYVYSGLTITYILSKFSDCEEQYNWMKRKR